MWDKSPGPGAYSKVLVRLLPVTEYCTNEKGQMATASFCCEIRKQYFSTLCYPQEMRHHRNNE